MSFLKADYLPSQRLHPSKKQLWNRWYRLTPLGRRTPLKKWVVPKAWRHMMSPAAQKHMRDRGL